MAVLELTGWTTDVERGPNWLFLKVHAPPEGVDAADDLADVVWHAMEQHFATRVVLELDQLPRLNSQLIGQLVKLQKRIASSGGTMRICGLSPANEAPLYATRLSKQLPCYRDRTDAVMCGRPGLPR